MAERLGQLRASCKTFFRETVPGVWWGVSARLDPSNWSWESLVIGSYFETRLKGGISPVRRAALRFLSRDDQVLAIDCAKLGMRVWSQAGPTMTELVEMSRYSAQRTGRTCAVPASFLEEI